MIRSSKANMLFVKNKPIELASRAFRMRFMSSSYSHLTNSNDEHIRESNLADPSPLYLKNLMRSPSSWQTPDIPDAKKVDWQPDHNLDIQRVTQLAIIHELTQQQTKTIEKIVPWFLDVMPKAYFRQVPESFRNDHMKAIAAVVDANMELHLNLKSNLPDGRKLLTFIRPGSEPGLLLKMIKDLPFKHVSAEYLPLSRVQIFAARDQSLWLNMFVYGEEKDSANFDPCMAGTRILQYAEKVQSGKLLDDVKSPKPNPLFERECLIDFIGKCSESFVARSNPQRFLTLRLLYEGVSGTEGTNVSIHNVSIVKETMLQELNENKYL